MVRVVGIGRLAISLKGLDDDIDIVNLRSGEKESCTWDRFTAEIIWLMTGEDNAEASWQQVYDEPYPEPETPKEPNHPEKTEVAPVQPKKKESKVTKAKVGKKPEPKQKIKQEPIQEKKPEPKTIKTEASEEIPGQESILDHPDCLPEGYGTIEQKVPENEPKEESIGTNHQKTDDSGEEVGTKQITRDELLAKGSEAAYAIYISIEGEKSGHMKMDIKGIKERMKQLQVIILDLAAKEK
jgi:outer membrane biosynthesis protein TonB